jgi:hypothetical protein
MSDELDRAKTMDSVFLESFLLIRVCLKSPQGCTSETLLSSWPIITYYQYSVANDRQGSKIMKSVLLSENMNFVVQPKL